MSLQREVRSRFAPSPTGYLHVGGARTALFAWAYAKRHQGTFILRIEDTDLERSTPESVQAILDGMHWLGLDYDEGPYFQTDRFHRYEEILQRLLDQGDAYRCYCSKARLEQLRTAQKEKGQKPRYDGHCRDLEQAQNGPFCVRFKNPKEGVVEFIDQVKGAIRFENAELDDLVIARTGGAPTYNFTVVVDDYDMKITEVIRGDDHVNNTPRQINIFKALGYEPPEYAHVPMILGEDAKRLSKRHGAVSVMQYYELGFLPEALLNYLVRLGWSHGDQEIFSQQEIVALFDTEHLNHAPAAFNLDKLLWLNQHYIQSASPAWLVKPFCYQLSQLGVAIDESDYLKAVIQLQQARAKTMKEMAEKSIYFFQEVSAYDPKAAKKFLNERSKDIFRRVYDELESTNDWDTEVIHEVVLSTSEHCGLKLGKVAQPIRVAMTGNTVSPPIDQTLALLGRERVLSRLRQALAFECSKDVSSA